MREVLKRFIVFEGLDGTGTTTHAARLFESIMASGRSASLTREPSDGIAGSLIREKVLKSGAAVFGNEALLHLYLADRFDHLGSPSGVRASLGKYDFVISDRYFFSTLAYQGVDLGFDRVMEENARFPLPEMVFYLDVPVSDCMERIGRRNEAPELFEKRNFLEKTRELYERAFSVFGELTSFVRVDATRDIRETSEDIRRAFEAKFPL